MPEQAGQNTGESAGVLDVAAAPLAVEAAAGIEAPSIAPDHEAPPKPDREKPDLEKPAVDNVEASRIVVPKLGAGLEVEPKSEVKPEMKAETNPGPKPGKLIVMAPSDRPWEREDFAPHVKADEPRETGGKRRLSAMAAIVALAACVGAISGALATAGVMHFAATPAPAPAQVQVADTSALESSVARIDADLVALKASVEHTSKTGVSQFNRTNDRLDKLEKAQAEPMAKLAKLSEAVDKLRATPPAAPAQAAAAPAKDITGSIASTQVATAAAAPAAAPKVEVGRLPTVEGWVLRHVANGGALIEGRGGLYEVYAGDPVPGVGRVDAIRRQDGRWVVVTSKGLIVAR
ncbi:MULTISPECIES: hypothetical protein [unclassified Bradyrhizobium]|uniref:hypothetical protein n=1 Tax=unclassified Bradyrhizobium TaxID=2631580 RepID=UPI00247B292E|nr:MULTISPECIES: hypothetical protein [unclassified Bradyrhizobium]WGR75269.1 hypothetical protein MTX24_34280 [Bradyrhizobium sp. ISRA426]WGR82770.1 hypothetical protein MTX21_19380 [Bradyrhizobium sp. ISRA430]WGR90467.1 hypothetical protein MTX25_33960 [Bradyrhizobium sp. ISRA432]